MNRMSWLAEIRQVLQKLDRKRVASLLGGLLVLTLLCIAAWTLGTHRFFSRTVNEPLPFAEPTPFIGFLASRAAAHFPADSEIGVIMPPTTEPPTPSPKTHSAAAATSTKIIAGVKAAPTAPPPIAVMPAKVLPVVVEPPLSVPMVVGQGQFVDGDNFHKGSGLATLYGLADGSHLLRFDDFTATSGPALHVLLSPNLAPTDHASLGDYLDLGELKGNIGDQNYEIAADIDLTGYKSVVIYCLPFEIIFATAPLE